MKGLFNELRRRNVFRVGFAYLVVAWLLVQVAATVEAPLSLPGWFDTAVIVLLGVGFPVALILAWAYELTPEGIQHGSVAERVPVAAFGRKWDFAIIAGLVAALGYSLLGHESFTEAEPSAESAGLTSLAVLPFADISPRGDQEYFADGITEELLNSLARIDELRVPGRTSSFYFKGRNEDLRRIGEQLGAEHILEGSVRKAGDELRITAQLVNARTGYHLWSDTYDRRLEDVFEIQAEIAAEVAEALEVTLGVGELGRLPGMTRSVDAYEAFLRGRVAITGGASDAQLDALERAVELDPSFAQAWAELAIAYRYRRDRDEPARAEEWREKSENALERARALASDAAVVMNAFAWVATSRKEWAVAESVLRRALDRYGDRAPSVNLAFALGNLLLGAGKAAEAVAYLETARRIDPLNRDASAFLAQAYDATGRLDEALAEYDRLDGPESIGFHRVSALHAAAETGAEQAEIERRRERFSDVDWRDLPVNETMARHLDNPEAARRALREMYEGSANLVPTTRGRIARWAAHFGDAELALALLVELEAFGPGSTARWTPSFSEVRGLPGFKNYVRDAGLVEYWRETGWGDFCRPIAENDLECQ